MFTGQLREDSRNIPGIFQEYCRNIPGVFPEYSRNIPGIFPVFTGLFRKFTGIFQGLIFYCQDRNKFRRRIENRPDNGTYNFFVAKAFELGPCTIFRSNGTSEGTCGNKYGLCINLVLKKFFTKIWTKNFSSFIFLTIFRLNLFVENFYCHWSMHSADDQLGINRTVKFIRFVDSFSVPIRPINIVLNAKFKVWTLFKAFIRSGCGHMGSTGSHVPEQGFITTMGSARFLDPSWIPPGTHVTSYIIKITGPLKG